MASSLGLIRSQVRSNIDKHLYDTALFWADKAVSLSQNDVEDVFWLAQCHYVTGQFKRAIHVLTSHHLLSLNVCCLYLAVRCYAACKEHEEGLSVLEKNLPLCQQQQQQQADGFESLEKRVTYCPLDHIESAVELLRGTLHEALDSRAAAIASYTRALQLNICCVEAFDRLVAHHMLTGAEERELFESLPFDAACGPDAPLLRALYASKMKKYEPLPPSARDIALPTEMQSNLDVVVSAAERFYYACDFRRSHELTARVLDEDPFHHDCLPVHIACQVELQDTNGLFYMAHKLVDSYPERAVSWFAVGCYYMLIKNYVQARRYFGKATHLDARFGPGWLGFGHAFAVEGEHDQAMAAYCSAARLMPGCHLPLLCVGIEYMQTNNLRMALQHMDNARAVCGEHCDPLVLNELGVVKVREGGEAALREALTLFTQARARCAQIGEPLVCAKMWESVLFNLGRVQQKLGNHTEAIEHFQQALVLAPHVASSHAGLAYSLHCSGQLDEAIVTYHNALALDADDVFSSSMLRIALTEQAEAPLDVGSAAASASASMMVAEDASFRSDISLDCS